LYDNQSKLNKAYERFVPYEFINALGKGSILDVKLGDQIHQDMNVMFCDIRSYSRLAEGMTPKENFNFINAYLKRVGPVIRNNGGFINHYFGDGFIALFKDSSRDAVEAALQIFDEIELYNIKRVSENRGPIQIGIGLHTGEVMMGIIGDKERNDANVISDSVNTASRLEGLTKIFESNFIISQSTFKNISIDGNYNTRFLGRVKVKGKDDILPIYEVFDADLKKLKDSKLSVIQDYEKAFDAYLNKNFEGAISLFSKVRKAIPDDYATNLYLKRCIEYANEKLPSSWSGVEEMTEK
jgi:two-component system sensor histidine kinase ChiS